MGLFLVVAMLVLVFLGLPIALSLGVSSIISLIIQGQVPLQIIVQRMFSGCDSFVLMAVPFFILAGNLMESGGISKRLVRFVSCLIGPVNGGLALVTIGTCLLFGAVSGSAAATTACIGAIMIPEMVKRDYDLDFSAATVASASSLGILIPPSIPLVLYGTSSGQSIGTLFIATIGPAFIVAGALMVVAYFVSKKEDYKGEPRTSMSEKFAAFKDAFWALLMPVIILGGIYGGIFTATESAVIAVFYGFIVGLFIYKELKVKDIMKILASSATTTASIMLILATAAIFGWIMTRERVPETIAQAFLSFSNNKYVFLFLINLLLLFIGCIFESSSAIILLTPILFPITKALGIDPIHFGVIMVVTLSIGYVTPPLGIDLYIACDIAKIKIEAIVRRVVPYIIAMIVALFIITYFPEITFWLPRMMGMM